MTDALKPVERTSRKEALIAVGLGIVFMAVALFVQSIVQQIPEYIYLGLHGFSISLLVSGYSKLEFQHPLEFGLYLGLVAATMQEASTYIAVDTRTKQYAFYIGLGFSAVDIIVLMFDTLPVIGRITRFPALLIILNVIASILFHPGTATFMKWGRIAGFGKGTLGISILLHTVIDGGVAFLDLWIPFHASQYVRDSAIFWAIAMAISAGIFIVGLKKLRKVEESVEREKPVVF
ncbi:MAG: hypothetical protein M1592_01710 [Candidatus Thermoplasmatota archaeon]|jgi:hypothetical protein|nr:hypothetical protein [Candidatus Thermoplasmatota archaeon]